MSALLAELLHQRVKTNGSAPLFTFYDLNSGARTELSAASFSNWVDKTSNLLVDEVAVDEGDVISMPLALEAPGHWLTAVWELACWQVGVVVDLTNPTQPATVVTGRHWEGHAARDVFACALDPMGFGFGESLPDGIRDYAVEVRRHADRFFGSSPDTGATAWVDAERTLTQADLVEVDGPPTRRLVRADEPWNTCRDGVVTALVTGGSTVVVVGADADQVARIADSERVLAP
ncbi:MAG TPA: TIGR03089 family protein [Propionibacteriaceae bacterium]|nr:TIGR03089 family protein [Propionibacteriaceae bacterium]